MNLYPRLVVCKARLAVVTTGTLLLMPLPALAYLDPTTGSMVISAIVGLFASLVLAIRTYWYRIKGFFGRHSARVTASSKDKAEREPKPGSGDDTS